MWSFFLSACGGGGGGSGSKNLFSSWTSTQTGFILDLSGFSFSEEVPYDVFFNDGSVCQCNLVVFGSQSSGNYSVNSCYYRFGSGPADPGCNLLNGGGSYNNSNNILTLTDATSTSTFRKPENSLVNHLTSEGKFY